MNLAPMPPYNVVVEVLWTQWARDAIPMPHRFRELNTSYRQDYDAVREASKAGDPEAVKLRTEFHNYLVTRRLKG